MAQVKIVGLLALTAVMTAGACVSSSVIAANINKEPCKSSPNGKNAYHWAWATAVAGGVTSGVCLGGIILAIIV